MNKDKQTSKPESMHIYSDGSVLMDKDHQWLQNHMKKQRQARKTQAKKRRPIKRQHGIIRIIFYRCAS